MAYQRGGYWYRSVRNGRQVGKEYLGAGELGALVAQFDALEAERRAWEREELRATIEGQAAIDAKLDAAGAALRALTRAALLANGYHQHKGTWRKARHGRKNALGEDARVDGQEKADG